MAMGQPRKFWHGHWLAAAALAFSGAVAPAYATDPLPGDEVAPAVNINIGMLYNQYSNAGDFGEAHGGTISDNTRITDDIVTARYIRTFAIAGMEGGVQAYIPYVAFLGHQTLGINPSPETFGEPAIASLRSGNGFGQPNIGVFLWALKDAAAGNYLVVAPWISPPVGSFNETNSLNPAPDVWQYELELGGRTTFYGTPSTRNVALSFWASGYVYGSNKNAAFIQPAVTIPVLPFPPFSAQSPQSSAPASFHEQPTLELRAYLPYEFYPASHAFIAPGFYQSFGGKQTYNVQGGPTVDSGNRTNESQLRLVLSTFIAPNAQILAMGEYDVAAHGAPLNRVFDVRLTVLY